MKNIFVYGLTSLAFSFLSIASPAESFEIPEESISHFSLPELFSMKKICEKHSTFIFKTKDVIFAQGKFNKKFSLKTPYGKTITTARIYELIPNNDPLLVIRNGANEVLGYVHLQNYQRSKLFKPLMGIVYDRSGTHVLTAKFPLSAKCCKIYAVQGQEKPIYFASTKNGEEGIEVTFSPHAQELPLDPLLVASVLHVHASKSLLVQISKFNAIDEIDINDLENFSRSHVSEKYMYAIQEPQQDTEQELLFTIQEQLKEGFSITLTPEEQETAVDNLSQKFTEEVSLEQIEESLPALSEEEKTALFHIIESRVGA